MKTSTDTENGAVTLDDLIAYAKGVVDVMDSDESRAILASLDRLRAIEQAAGMPEPVARIRVVNITENGNKTEIIEHVLASDYDKLTAHCLHLQTQYMDMAMQVNIADEKRLDAEDRLARIMLFKAMSAALLAKLEKEK